MSAKFSMRLSWAGSASTVFDGSTATLALAGLSLESDAAAAFESDAAAAFEPDAAAAFEPDAAAAFESDAAAAFESSLTAAGVGLPPRSFSDWSLRSDVSSGGASALPRIVSFSIRGEICPNRCLQRLRLAGEQRRVPGGVPQHFLDIVTGFIERDDLGERRRRPTMPFRRTDASVPGDPGPAL